jgi:hypothetical protein
MKVDDRIYLKGMFQLEASSWLTDNLDGCWHDAYNQWENNSQDNPEDEWSVKLIQDEASNTTLGGTLVLDKQQEE